MSAERDLAAGIDEYNAEDEIDQKGREIQEKGRTCSKGIDAHQGKACCALVFLSEEYGE